MGTKNNPGKFDCYEKAESDEPRFVLLGRDSAAPNLVRSWAATRALMIVGGFKPKGDWPKVEEARHCADAMDVYRAQRKAAKK